MSRDLVEREKWGSYTTQTPICPHGNVKIVTSSNDMITEYRYRGDLKKSDHIRATPYRCHRYACDFANFEKRSRVWWTCSGITAPYERVVKGQAWLTVQMYGSVEGKPWHIKFPQRLVNEARTKALNKMSTHDLNLAQFAGEMPESLGLLRDSLVTGLRAYRALRRGDIAGVRRAFRSNPRTSGLAEASGKYLGTIFGWKPLIEDSYNLYRQVTGRLNGKRPLRVSAVASEDIILTNSSERYIITKNGKIKKGVQVGLVYGVSDPRLANLASQGLTNPAALAWELLPLSFVVDWFIPIGQLLDAVDAHLGLTFKAGYQTKFAYGEIQIEDTYFGGRPTEPLYVKNPIFKVSTFGMDRIPINSWPTPGLWVKTGLSPGQGLTALALAAQRLG